MKPIHIEDVQKQVEGFFNKAVYIHLETTNGAYAAHQNENFFSTGAYIRNGQVQITRGKITGNGPYRAGLKIELGWIYAEGLTHWEVDEKGRLLLAGYDNDGKLGVALQLSTKPF
ncbi:YojF family protein [Aneurinibacillus terranovensis]|uniref:YojF family protein n=1 Tax=Aneurinibacillus terranovensis TaxID=278991 RepID=UPI000485DEE4|nr:YojF family protein [Aneurinibacillus terranovensis]